MSQYEVYNFLKANIGKKFNIAELADQLNKSNKSTLTTNCMKLRRSNDIACDRMIASNGHKVFYYYIPKGRKKIDNSEFY